MLDKLFKRAAAAALLFAAASLCGGSAAAASHKAHKRHVARATGTHELVNDGPGTPYGFHRDPAPFRIGARIARHRQADALQETVDTDALTSGGYYGFPGDSVYGAGNRASYGVFNGADGYGSPYFAGFYGPGGGTDYGPFGHAYDD